MAVRRFGAEHVLMDERNLHVIQDDLTETWLEEWAGDGVAEVEAYLAKHAAFLSYLESREAA